MPKKKKTITEDHWWGSLPRVDKQKHIPNDPMSKASRVLSGGIKKAGDFVKSSVTKGFKSYVGTKGIHLTNTNVNGIQSGQIKGKEITEVATVGNPKPTTGNIILSHTSDIKYKITNPWE